MMNSGIVCGRQMSARASSAAAWLVAIQKKRPGGENRDAYVGRITQKFYAFLPLALRLNTTL